MGLGALGLVAVAGVMLRGDGATTSRAAAYEDVRAAYCPSDLNLLDRNGSVLEEVRVDSSRRRLGWTTLAEISPALQRAVLLSEDRRFYDHRGVDVRAVAAAVRQNIRGATSRGASTISMQLAALLRPELRRGSSPRSLMAKWRQMRAAWDIETSWTKQQVLEAYLNLVTFRSEIQGVAAASQVLLGKAPHGLTTVEAALLAASLRSPNAGAAALRDRAVTLLAALDAAGFEYELDAVFERTRHAVGVSALRRSLAPQAARRLFSAREASVCEDLHSSLDADTQVIATESLRRHLLAIRDRSVRDGAVVVVDNPSGEVLAYVGSSGDLSAAAQLDGVQALRQAGSTLKPFLYALAFQKRLLTPATLLEDSPLQLSRDGGIFEPRDYEADFRGLVSVRTALAGSLNVPAVRSLELIGEDTFADALREFGFDSVTRSGTFYGPSLALGSADVSLWQLVNAYRALANRGLWSPLRWSVGEHDDEATRRVVDEGPAYLVSDILSDRGSRAATFDLDSPLSTPFWSAVKTGTSNDMRDNWCIGFSSRYTVGVWVGNFSGEPMRDVSGVTGAAPVWHEVMSWLQRNRADDAASSRPRGVIDAWTAFADDVEAPRREVYLEGTEPAATSSALATRARIVTPVSGTVVAIDPDIPAQRQRVVFIAETAAGRPIEDALLRWRLDGTDLGAVAGPLLWSPTPGHHTLDLIAADAQTLPSVSFEVRGKLSAEPRNVAAD